jgi:hypothetical protein
MSAFMRRPWIEGDESRDKPCKKSRFHRCKHLPSFVKEHGNEGSRPELIHGDLLAAHSPGERGYPERMGLAACVSKDLH